MAIPHWKKNYIIRVYGEPYNQDGYEVTDWEDRTVRLDVQTLSDSAYTQPYGDRSVQRVKAFGDYQFRPASEGIKADKLWFQGRWFECIAARWSGNTWIRHWTSEFVECADQEEAPDGKES